MAQWPYGCLHAHMCVFVHVCDRDKERAGDGDGAWLCLYMANRVISNGYPTTDLFQNQRTEAYVNVKNATSLYQVVFPGTRTVFTVLDCVYMEIMNHNVVTSIKNHMCFFLSFARNLIKGWVRNAEKLARVYFIFFK